MNPGWRWPDSWPFLIPEGIGRAGTERALAEHGVTVKVVTGDNEVVTARVCRKVELSGQDLAEAVKPAAICAKVSPLAKARVVKALQAGGGVG
jgi:Mg2+-importing ATPase